jgi:hypothetical protein
MKLKALLLALAVAGGTASLALAGNGHGKGDEHGHPGKAKKADCRPSIQIELRGTVAAAPSGSALAVLVTKGGAQGASLAGKQLTLDLSGLKKPVTLEQGDGVRVHARACVDLAAGTVRLVADRVDTKGGSEHGTTTAATTAAASALPTTSVPKLTTTVTR